jgi:hypothetical protein
MIEIIANDRLGRKGECLRTFAPCSNTGGINFSTFSASPSEMLAS